ncbi:MAG: response regulator transcription factor [Thermomicrobiales bacterium]
MRILIVEDEARLADLISKMLRQEHFETDVAGDGDEGLDLALTGGYDVIVLDRMLPGMDGIDVIEALRRERVDTPVLMLTALGELPERVEGLNAGADDYLGKPFAFEELVARIRSLARRVAHPLMEEILQIGPLRIDLTGHVVTRDDQAIELSPREFAMLEAMVRNRGHVLSRDLLLERVWGYDADPQGNVVDLYVHYLRRKLDPERQDPEPLIRTVRGAGYMVG